MAQALSSCMTAIRQAKGPRGVELKVPTFDGHLKLAQYWLAEVFDGIHAAQEIDSGIQA